MKKIVAFLLSVSMCLSLLTVLSPAFAYEQEGEKAAMTRMVDNDKKPDPDRKPIADQGENN